MHTETFPPDGLFPEDEQPAPAAEPWPDHYQLNDFIGGRFKVIETVPGGMARVYLCYDREQDYFYALKTFRFRDQVLRDPAARTQLDGEVRKWIALGEHDHVVRCYRLEVIDNLPFIVMEWVAGSDLLCEEY